MTHPINNYWSAWLTDSLTLFFSSIVLQKKQLWLSDPFVFDSFFLSLTLYFCPHVLFLTHLSAEKAAKMRVRAASMTQVALTQAARFSPDEYATLLELPDTYRELAKKGRSYC